MISKWQKILGLNAWDIVSKRIDRSQVVFPKDISPGDRYFTGISIDGEKMKGTIYHDDDLTEEAVIHELLHLRFPDSNEEWVDGMTGSLVRWFGNNKEVNNLK